MVVTKIKTVEVESDGLRERLEECVNDLSAAYKDNTQLREQLKTLKENCVEAQQSLTTAQNQLKQHDEKVLNQQQEVDRVKQAAAAELSEIQQQHEQEVASLRVQGQRRVSQLTDALARMQGQLLTVSGEMEALKHEYRALREQCQSLPGCVQDNVQQTMKEIVHAISDINKHNQELVRKYRKEMALRKKFHNELVELKGNIRVFCRVRPSISEDGSGAQAVNVVAHDPDDDALLNVTYKGRIQAFEMDQVFPPHISQTQVFQEVAALVTSCIDGYNVCIFAYGQTGSGKTYTMEGPGNDPGINQRALRELFRETKERSGEWKYSISVSVMEIYNEALRDLLSSSANKLDIKMTPDGGSLHVPGLKSTVVTSVNDVNQVFKVGQENRATACTNMNEHSSRSHALLQVKVEGVNATTGARTHGKLNLVDLAGSERVSKSGADGARLKEAQSINKSLACLGDVIHALRTKQPHIPYRNSKLTYLLQDSLGGDSKTLMIVQVAPVDKNVSETLASLNFAQRVRTIELGQASKKMESAEMAELREKLAQYEGEPTSNGMSNGRTPSKMSGKTQHKNKHKIKHSQSVDA